MSDYNLLLEMIAAQSVEDDTTDPRKDVPYAVLYETFGTLTREIPLKTNDENTRDTGGCGDFSDADE